MWGTIIAAVLALLGKVFGWSTTTKDERDAERAAGEHLGQAEVRAASAETSEKEAQDAARTADDVRGLSDRALDDELRNGPKP